MSNSRFEFLENYYYHVYNRWFDKQIIFKNKNDFEKFYTYIVKELKEYENIKLVSYCILPNHFHFIIHNLETGLKLSDFMRKIQVSYAMYFKRKYETGLRKPVFEWRFKAKYIKDEEYLAKCLSYVNYNAVKHWVVDNINDYPRSSYHQLDKKRIDKYKDFIIEELEI